VSRKALGSWRCSICGINWPDEDRYAGEEACPVCAGDTWWDKSDAPDMSSAEAAELAGDVPEQSHDKKYPVNSGTHRTRKEFDREWEIEKQCEEMRDWLDGASADDFDLRL
jgi:hypothetical protein